MRKGLAALLIVGSVFAHGVAFAGTCTVENADSPTRWRFVHVYDVNRGEVVLRQALKGGDKRQVTVKGDHVRVNHKFAGDARYTPGIAKVCKNGNIVRF